MWLLSSKSQSTHNRVNVAAGNEFIKCSCKKARANGMGSNLIYFLIDGFFSPAIEDDNSWSQTKIKLTSNFFRVPVLLMRVRVIKAAIIGIQLAIIFCNAVNESTIRWYEQWLMKGSLLLALRRTAICECFWLTRPPLGKEWEKEIEREFDCGAYGELKEGFNVFNFIV